VEAKWLAELGPMFYSLKETIKTRDEKMRVLKFIFYIMNNIILKKLI
jgi:hypothetical protein